MSQADERHDDVSTAPQREASYRTLPSVIGVTAFQGHRRRTSLLVSLLGSVTAVVHLDHLLAELDEFIAMLIGVGPTLIISLVLVYAGWWLFRSDIDDQFDHWIAFWTVSGTIAVVIVGTVVMVYQAAHETPLTDVSYMYVNWASSGALGGFILGVYDAQRRASQRDLRESHRQLSRKEQALEETTEQLEALNRVVRHDIRNDMAVILGWAKTLEDHVDTEGRDALDRVLTQSRHVVELTETAREFIESLSQEGSPTLTPIDLQQTLHAEVETARETYPEATIQVHELPSVQVQATEMLSAVFRNLLSNAAQHTGDSPPEITVSAEAQDKTVTVRVADTGPGIPDDQKEKIFGKGEKGLDSEGTGIGLYLVQTLVEQFNGKVWVEDNGPTGAVFVVELNRAAGAPP